MSSNPQSSSPDSPHAKPSFRRHSSYAAGRKYRRHSPMSGSPLSDGSPKQDLSREDSSKVFDSRSRRKNDGMELARDSSRGRTDKGGGDLYRYSEKQSIGSSHHHRKHDDYSRHDDYNRHHRYPNEGERGYNRSFHSVRESRSGMRSDNRRRESEHERSRDYRPDKYAQDKPLEVRSKDRDMDRDRDRDRDSSVLEHQKHKDTFDSRGWSNSAMDEIRTGERNSQKRSFGDYRDSERFSNEESRGHGKDSSTTRGIGGSELKGTRKSNSKEVMTREGYVVEKKRHEDKQSDRHIDQCKRDLEENDYRSSSNSRKRDWRNEKKEDETSFVDEDHDSKEKKLKMVTSGCSSSRSTSKFDEKLPSDFKQFQETVSSVSYGNPQSSTSEAEGGQDLNAAKVAAMKAAELVNLNLKGSGFMSADQKKKLLWGNKKNNTAVEESGNRWDMSLFPDKERQEKFYKLMGVKGDVKIEHKPDGKESSGLLQAEKQQELQLDLEKQYTAGLRRRDGRTVGLGL